MLLEANFHEGLEFSQQKYKHLINQGKESAEYLELTCPDCGEKEAWVSKNIPKISIVIDKQMWSKKHH